MFAENNSTDLHFLIDTTAVVLYYRDMKTLADTKRYALYGTKGNESRFLHTSMPFASVQAAKDYFEMDLVYWRMQGWQVNVIVKL